MQTIGERLQEARKKKNITIREAAEATKIRGEFLAYFEDNHFDINLPEIYCKGFVKLYAKYLGLDAEQIGVEYNAYKMGSVRVSHAPRRDSQQSNQQGQFGYIKLDDIPAHSTSPAAGSADDEETASPSFIQKAVSHLPFTKSQPAAGKSSASTAPSLEDFEPYNDKSIYLKIAAVIGASLVAILLLVLIVRVISSSPKEPSVPAVTESRAITTFPQTLRFTNRGASGYFNVGIQPLGDEQATSQGFRLHAQQPQAQTLSQPVRIGLIRVPNTTTSGPYRLTITRDDGREATISFNNSAILHYDGELILVREDSARTNRVIDWE